MKPHLALLCLALAAGGCTTPPAIDVVRIEPGQYEAAFDAALEAARASGLPAAVRDRRSGVIETEPGYAPSYLEPWARGGHDSPGRRLEQTISFERLRARFEFRPAGFDARAAEADTSLHGPDILALEEPIIDRSRYDGDLELRVWVYVEQSHHPGVRRGTWTRRNVTRSIVVAPDSEDGTPLPSVFWTPVSRDREFEQTLLAKVQEGLVDLEGPSTPDPARP